MEDVNVLYYNFYPTADLKSFLAIELSKIDRLSPSDSILICHLSRDPKTWNIEIQINSSHGRFRVAHQGRCLADIIIKVLNEMTNKLQRWAVMKHQFEFQGVG